MMVAVVYLVVCACLLPYCLSQTLVTYPIQNEGEDKIIVVTSNDYESVSIYCEINSDNNAITNWTAINGAPIEFDPTTGQGLSPYDYLSVADDLSAHANLTYNFTMSEETLIELNCHSSDDMKTFLIGFPAAPVLVVPFSIYVVIEGDDFSLDLEDMAPFPPYNNPLTSVWLLDGNTINNTLITVGEYNITVKSVWRSLTGMKFKLTVSTDIGSDTQNFTLNVQYPPEAETVLNNAIKYRSVGDNVTMIAAATISGNPSYTTIWRNPMDQVINNTIGGRFSFPVVGRLKITNINEDDFGTYRFVATNVIGDLEVMNMLIKHIPPGVPDNVSVSDIGDESVVITWTAPSSLGVPPLETYIIQLYSADSNNSPFETNLTMIEIPGLLPGTLYNYTVAATAGGSYMTGGIAGATFTTLFGVPRIDSTTTISEGERKIIVSYSLKHTGGYNPNDTSIGVICGKTNSLSLPTMTTSIGSGDSNAYLLDDNYIECMSNCLDNNRRGTLDVDGLLTAGVSYICVVVAGNEEGEFYYNTTSLIASIGIPAPPTVSVTVNEGSITVTVASQNPGVSASDDSYFFNVVVTDGNQVVLYNMSFNGTADRTFTVDLPIGAYTVQIYSQNMYGVSQGFSATANVTMNAPELPTVNNDDEFPFYAIVAISVGGTALIFIIFITIVIIAVCIRQRNKKDSISFYRSRYEMTMKRY